MTSTPLALVVRHADTAGLRLRKAIPRGADRLLLELTDPGGRLVAGQWRRDPARAVEGVRRLRTMHGPESAALLGDGVVLARDGADRRLPGLYQQVRRPGAQLVAHRAERRGVVRQADGSYLKVVRTSHLHRVAASLAPVDVPGLAVPTVTAVDTITGSVQMAALPGHTLHDLLQDGAVSDDVLHTVLRRVGAAVADLHLQQAAPSLSAHCATDELQVTRGWLQAATDFGLLAPAAWANGLRLACHLLSGPPAEPVRLHRDLHDKQLLIAPGEPVGMLDLDLSAAGEPALDLANLLTHLHLRHLQGLVDRSRWQAARTALIAGYRPGPVVNSRLPGYALDARLRLAAVYAFRGADPGLLEALLDPTHDKELTS